MTVQTLDETEQRNVTWRWGLESLEQNRGRHRLYGEAVAYRATAGTTTMHITWKAFMVPLDNTLRNLISFVPRFLVAAILFALFFGLATLGRRLVRRSLEKLSHIPWAVRVLLARLAYLFTLMIGLLVALSAANVNVATLVASLGVAGFAIGFALKDILENFIAGILLLFARPFNVGDQVTLGSFEGTVKDIQIRTTTLHTYDDETVVIPNSSVYTNPVVNHTHLGRRRYSVDFDTSVSVDLDRVEREALRIVAENPKVLKDPAPFVRIVQVVSGNDVLSWRLFFWADPKKAVEIATVSETLEQVITSLYHAGIATPTSTSATIVRMPEEERHDTDVRQDGICAAQDGRYHQRSEERPPVTRG